MAAVSTRRPIRRAGAPSRPATHWPSNILARLPTKAGRDDDASQPLNLHSSCRADFEPVNRDTSAALLFNVVGWLSCPVLRIAFTSPGQSHSHLRPESRHLPMPTMEPPNGAAALVVPVASPSLIRDSFNSQSLGRGLNAHVKQVRSFPAPCLCRIFPSALPRRKRKRDLLSTLCPSSHDFRASNSLLPPPLLIQERRDPAAAGPPTL